MKLFSVQEIKETRQKQTDTQIARGLKVAALVDAETKKLQDLQEQKELQTKTIQEDFASLFETLNAKRLALESEVGGLEKRKAEALKPVEDLQKALQLQKTTFDELQKEFEAQEQDLDSKESRLTAQIRDLTDLQSRMNSEREKFDLKLVALKSQENAVNDGYKQLQSQWSEFISSTQESANLISTWERELKQKEEAFKILQGEIQTQKDNIELNRTRLIDLQGTIQAAFA